MVPIQSQEKSVTFEHSAFGHLKDGTSDSPENNSKDVENFDESLAQRRVSTGSEGDNMMMDAALMKRMTQAPRISDDEGLTLFVLIVMHLR